MEQNQIVIYQTEDGQTQIDESKTEERDVMVKVKVVVNLINQRN